MATQQPQTAFSFDATNVAPNEGRADPIPNGWYVFMIDDSGIMPTKSGDGSYLKVRCTVQNGHYRGRKVFQNFNLVNPNADAVEIGRGQLSALLHAIGRLNIQQSTHEMHNVFFKARVKIRKGNAKTGPDGQIIDHYDDSNEIVSYKNSSENVELVEAEVVSVPVTGPGSFQPQAGQPWAQNQQPAQQSPQYAPTQGPWQPPQGQQPWQQPAPQQQPAMTPQQAYQQPQNPQLTPQGGPPAWSNGHSPAQQQPQPAQPQQPWNQQQPVQPPVQQQPWATQQLPPPGQPQQPQGQPPAQPMDPNAAAAQQAVPPWAVQR